MTNYDILKEYEEHQTPVPTYKELQQIKESVEKMKDVVLNTEMNNMKSIIEIVNITKENAQLKELLKECRDKLEGEFGIGAANLVEEIDEVLK